MSWFEMIQTVLLFIVVQTVCGQKSEYKENLWNLNQELEEQTESTWLMDSKLIFMVMMIAIIFIVFLNIKDCKNLRIKGKSSEHVV